MPTLAVSITKFKETRGIKWFNSSKSCFFDKKKLQVHYISASGLSESVTNA
jgi:hypothetical protein